MSTPSSRRAVFQEIAQTSYHEWPAYATTALYDRSSAGGLKEDASTVADVWFDHDAHKSTEEFVCYWPLAYAALNVHDRYTGQTRYEMEQLVRVFLLKEIHGWAHETALISYLEQRPALCRQLSFETIPDQSTLWRTWHCRFSTRLQETIQECARTILIKAEKAGVDVPRSPQKKAAHPDNDDDALSDQARLSKADDVTDELQRTAYPALSLNRDDSSEIHPNSFWDLQAYLGLRELRLHFPMRESSNRGEDDGSDSQWMELAARHQRESWITSGDGWLESHQ